METTRDQNAGIYLGQRISITNAANKLNTLLAGGGVFG